MTQTAILNGAAAGALSGFISAAAVDFQAFRAWKNFDDASTYGWNTAIFRWLQGIVIGAVSGAGLSGFQLQPP